VIPGELLQRDVGARVAELRREKGLTQEELAQRVGTNLKHLQRIEAGRANLTLRSLATLASALGVEVLAFFRTPLGPPRRRGRPRRTLPPGLLHARVSTANLLTTAVPVLTLTARTGLPDELADTGLIDWIELPGRPRTPGLFVVRVVGESMGPLLPDGSLSLFRAGTRRDPEGALVLVELDVEAGRGRYLFKRLRTLRAADGAPLGHELVSSNPEVPTLELLLRDDGGARVVAEFIEMLPLSS
jgi:transcriptional regulator with XRE-family HTH domain